jgi:hypothetical protein
MSGSGSAGLGASGQTTCPDKIDVSFLVESYREGNSIKYSASLSDFSNQPTSS